MVNLSKASFQTAKRMKSVSLLLLVYLATMFATVFAAGRHTTATGRALCRFGGISHPLKEVKVKLVDDDLFFDDTFAESVSGLDGRVTLSGQAHDFFGPPKIYISIVYTYSGVLGKLEIDGLFNVDRFYNTPRRPIKDNVDFGDIIISDDHCRAYVLFYNALSDYNTRTGISLPYSTLHVCTHAIIHGGTPYALLNKVMVPKNYPVSFETAKHELAHTVRHSLVRLQWCVIMQMSTYLVV